MSPGSAHSFHILRVTTKHKLKWQHSGRRSRILDLFPAAPRNLISAGRGAMLERYEQEQRSLEVWGPMSFLSRSTAATAALLEETHTIPIVFVIVSDPVSDGFVESMARPGRSHCAPLAGRTDTK
jgi:hypothetical protein